MSSHPSGAAVATRPIRETPKARGFLHIVRHGAGLNAFYIVSYHQIARTGVRPKPMLAEGAQALIDMLERSAWTSASAKSAARSKTFCASAPPTFPTSGSATKSSSKKASSKAEVFRFGTLKSVRKGERKLAATS